MSHALSSSIADRAYFTSLPAHIRAGTCEWFDVIKAILKAKNKSREIRAQRHRMAGRRGFSRANINRKYYVVLNGGGWLSLVNRAKLKRKQDHGSP